MYLLIVRSVCLMAFSLYYLLTQYETIFSMQQAKKHGGPVIHNYVHTETQDGKSLLDAHFAHSTAKVKRHLANVRPNMVNKVTSPSELAEGLSSHGGLRHTGVQLVCFDQEVAKVLSEIKAKLELSLEAMGEYFARANEFQYFPDSDQNHGHKSSVHVRAYSGIGQGARFEVDLDTGAVEVAGGDFPKILHEEESKDELEIGDNGEEEPEDEFYGADLVFTEDEEDLEDILLEFYLAEDNNVNEKDLTSAKGTLLSTNGNPIYNSADKLTGVKVERTMRPFSIASRSIGGQQQNRQESAAVSQSPKQLRTFGARAIMAMESECIESIQKIRQASDDSSDAYIESRGFNMPVEHGRNQGWARRGRDLYGTKFIGEYKARVLELFNAGKEDDSKKMNADQMVETLVRENPGVYTLPSVPEVDSFIGQTIQANKKNAGKKAKTAPALPKVKLEDEYESGINQILEKYEGRIMPASVSNLLAFKFKEIEGFVYAGATGKSKVPVHVLKAIVSMRKTCIQGKKRLLIG
jgi:hypothetical protein